MSSPDRTTPPGDPSRDQRLTVPTYVNPELLA